MMKSCTTKQRIICKKLHLQNNQLLSFINQYTHFWEYNIETDQDFIWKNGFHE
jgi:hypothetical protein